MTKARVASLFAGIGGICLGFIQAGAEIAYANEIDHNACRTYNEFFKNPSYLVEGDVYDQHLSPDDNIDIVAAGFPCQAFSIAGYRKGFGDDRGVLYTQVCRLVEECQPKAVFLENVKNLKSHNLGKTYKVIKDSLEDLGYSVTEKVLNSMEYGNVPQNRERIYVVAFKNNEDGSCPAMERFEFPSPVPLTKRLDEIIDFHTRQDDRFYYPKDHKYYPRLEAAMGKNPSYTVYQWRRVYVRENKSNVCPTLTANMGTGGHNVPLIRDDYDIRKLTPHECLQFQGFPPGYDFPPRMAYSHRYKQVGNSVTVPVVKRIAVNMLKASGFEYKKSAE